MGFRLELSFEFDCFFCLTSDSYFNLLSLLFGWFFFCFLRFVNLFLLFDGSFDEWSVMRFSSFLFISISIFPVRFFCLCWNLERWCTLGLCLRKRRLCLFFVVLLGFTVFFAEPSSVLVVFTVSGLAGLGYWFFLDWVFCLSVRCFLRFLGRFWNLK